MLVVVVLALAGGGVLAWRVLHGGFKLAFNKGPAPARRPTPGPFVPPPYAPKAGADMDPEAIDPLVVRLARVNALAHKMIVTTAEYHDTDGGQRYFVGVVTSCKALNAIWPIKRGVLMAEVEAPLRLKDDFPIFTFAEYGQAGQWGVLSCDGTV